MAWRFSDLVVDGELDNTVRGRVAGWIRLDGRAEPLVLDLRGDCHPDLAGWRFRIVRVDPVPPWAEPVDISQLSTEQFGETGDITADQVLRHYDCPVDELLARIRADEPPPTQWRKALYLEWYSDRNGRIVIQDTRLSVERVGERAFELTNEDLRRKEREAQDRLDDLRSEGLICEDDGSGIIWMRNEGADPNDPASDELRFFLDEQQREIDRAIQESLDDSPEKGEPPLF